LDGAAIFGKGEVEGGGAGAALERVLYRAAGGVVVVAEFFVAKAGATAATSIGEDVSALVALGGGLGGDLCGWHGCIPSPGLMVQSIQTKRPAAGLGVQMQAIGLNAQARLMAGLFFFCFHYRTLKETNCSRASVLF
jgi:hypothetical protein